MNKISNLFGCAVVLAVFATQAQADVIVPFNVSASSQFAPAINLINGSGLDGVGPVENQLHDNNENNMWQTFDAVNAPFDSIGETVEFDLGGNFDLLDTIVWQYNGPSLGIPQPQRESGDLDVAVSSAAAGPFTSIGTISLAASQDQSVAGFNEPAQIFSTAASNVRRVQFTILTIQGGLAGDGFAGLSEVRFNVVPEPTSFALCALGLLGLAGHRRKR